MLLLVQKVLRGGVLGLMFFLAGTAYCSCDSYDPDPYDDVPPVVTVEFNYLVPSHASIPGPQSQIKNKSSLCSGYKVQPPPPAAMPGLRGLQSDYSFSQGPPQWAAPLRR